MSYLYGSISSSPGRTGLYYYSNYFKYYKIDATYTPLKVNSIGELEVYLSDKMYLGLNISMPFKQQIIRYLSDSSKFVSDFESCNTVKRVSEGLQGFNTDVEGVLKVTSQITRDEYVIILGNGAMGKTFAKVLEAKGINYKVFSRSLNNWESRHESCDVLINCTALGTSMNKSPIEILNAERAVFDLAMNGESLKKMCISIDYESGIHFYKEVFLKQFSIHTEIIPDPYFFDYLTEKNSQNTSTTEF